MLATLCDQMKWFVCEKLATWMRVNIEPKTTESQQEDMGPERFMKNDWKLAAAVIDRIFCIFFGSIFLVGSIIFFITFAVGHQMNMHTH